MSAASSFRLPVCVPLASKGPAHYKQGTCHHYFKRKDEMVWGADSVKMALLAGHAGEVSARLRGQPPPGRCVGPRQAPRTARLRARRRCRLDRAILPRPRSQSSEPGEASGPSCPLRPTALRRRACSRGHRLFAQRFARRDGGRSGGGRAARGGFPRTVTMRASHQRFARRMRCRARIGAARRETLLARTGGGAPRRREGGEGKDFRVQQLAVVERLIYNPSRELAPVPQGIGTEVGLTPTFFVGGRLQSRRCARESRCRLRRRLRPPRQRLGHRRSSPPRRRGRAEPLCGSARRKPRPAAPRLVAAPLLMATRPGRALRRGRREREES
jgi:hypothetical protein